MIDLKKILKQKGLTITEAADVIGISQGALSQQINNESIKVKTLCAIADGLGMPLTDLLQDADASSNVVTITCPHCSKTIHLQVITDD